MSIYQNLMLAFFKIEISFREDQPPVIANNDCRNCPICTSRTANLDDKCENISIEGDNFFSKIVTHTPHQDGTVTFSGLNLKNAILIPKRK